MLMQDRDGRKDGNSGYSRVFDNDALGVLLSKVQATVISNGSELERIITEQTRQIENLDEFIDNAEIGEIELGVFVCSKKVLKKSRYKIKDTDTTKMIEPDFLVFIISNHRVCKIIELKDGDTFDTKKVRGEREHLKIFAKEFGSQIPFKAEFYFCCFNQKSHNAILVGLKNAFEETEILTGEEFCKILNLDYNLIVERRKQDASKNLDYFIDELLKIKQLKDLIVSKL